MPPVNEQLNGATDIPEGPELEFAKRSVEHQTTGNGRSLGGHSPRLQIGETFVQLSGEMAAVVSIRVSR